MFERDPSLFLIAERVMARDVDAFRFVVLKRLLLLRLEFLGVIPLCPLT